MTVLAVTVTVAHRDGRCSNLLGPPLGAGTLTVTVTDHASHGDSGGPAADNRRRHGASHRDGDCHSDRYGVPAPAGPAVPQGRARARPWGLSWPRRREL